MFDNDVIKLGDGSAGTSTDLGKYFIDRNTNGLKDGTCGPTEDSTAKECYVDVWFNYAEGNLKGTYTAVTADEKSKVKPQGKKAVIFGDLYQYTDTADFKKRVDNSMAGQMRDCGECHVGGGAFEHVPVAQGILLADGARKELRNTPAIVTTGVNTFNYFIDQYDDNNDGSIGEVLPQNYANTGVLEMDCLICHLEGYSWDNRTAAIRKGNFDASRVAGAGLGTADNAGLGSAGIGLDGNTNAGYGKTVTYDSQMVINDGEGFATLSAQVLNAIVGTPPSANCSSCHFDLHKVDWKKRGDTWHKDMSYEREVHASIGCMGCHARTDNLTMDPEKGTADNPLWTGNATSGDASKTLGHDPSKGNAPYGSIWNANDNTVRTCAGCHIDKTKTYYGTGGAPDPTNVHTMMGLTKTLIQTKGMGKMDGIANGNHLDIIMCEGCHSRKVGHGPLDSHSLYEWGTGGAMVDGSGPDTEGRLTDHENLYVERTMENNLGIAWSGGGKLGPRNALVSMFWLNKDDLIDINADGQLGGMDPINPSHVRNALKVANLQALTADGDMSEEQIIKQKAALRTYLANPAGPTGAGIGDSAKLKLSLMGVFFKSSHGTTPAANAWGAGGCQDCHGKDKGFYNGPYDLKPRDLKASWVNNAGTVDNSAVEGGAPNWKYVVPFTMVNIDNYSGRDLARPLCSTYYGPNPRPALPTMGTIEQIGEVCTEGGTSGIWTVYPLGKIKADAQFTDFHPTTWAKGQVGRSIAITAAFGGANTIRTMDRSEGLWEAKFVNGTYNGTIKGTDGKNYTTRTAWVDYLNTRGSKYRPAIHFEHVEGQGMNCSDCHYDGTNHETNDPSKLAANYAVATDSSPYTTQFSYTPRPGTGAGTCTTTCHDVAVVGAITNKATARISDTHSSKNNQVILDGRKSACYSVSNVTGQVTQSGVASYTWGPLVDGKLAGATLTECGPDVAGVPSTVPGAEPVPGCKVATWPAVGPHVVTLAVTCGGTAGSDSATKTVTGFQVEGLTQKDIEFFVTNPTTSSVQLAFDASALEVPGPVTVGYITTTYSNPVVDRVDISWVNSIGRDTTTLWSSDEDFAASAISKTHTYAAGDHKIAVRTTITTTKTVSDMTPANPKDNPPDLRERPIEKTTTVTNLYDYNYETDSELGFTITP